MPMLWKRTSRLMLPCSLSEASSVAIVTATTLLGTICILYDSCQNQVVYSSGGCPSKHNVKENIWQNKDWALSRRKRFHRRRWRCVQNLVQQCSLKNRCYELVTKNHYATSWPEWLQNTIAWYRTRNIGLIPTAVLWCTTCFSTIC